MSYSTYEKVVVNKIEGKIINFDVFVTELDKPFNINIMKSEIKSFIKSLEVYEEALQPKPIEEWHEDDGNVIWWKLPIEEPPYVGTPLDSDFEEEYYTHFTSILMPLIDNE